MIKQNALVAKANGAIPANGKSFKDISPDRKRALCKANVGVGDGHFGLEGIRERARLFGGSATIRSVLGAGTRIVVHLPLVEEAGGKA